MSSLAFRQDQRLNQTLSPRLQHAVRLLQMSSLEFAAMVRDTLVKNPFLEIEEGDDNESDEDSFAPPDDAAAADLNDANDGAPTDPHDADGSGDRDLWQAEDGSGRQRFDDGEMSAMDSMAFEPSLAMHLHGQLNLLPLQPRDLALARTLVESLDDDGYLRTPLAELLAVETMDPVATLPEMQIALRRVQSLDPAGVAARSVAECLLLQLPAIDCTRMRALAQTILNDHMSALAARDVAGLARVLGVPAAQVQAVCDRIRRLDPRPGWRLGASQLSYVVPDVVVKKRHGQWAVQLNPAVVPKVRLNQVYEKLFQRHRTAQNVEMGNHLQEARWTLRNVEQRFSTIVEVAQAIVKRQQNFLDYGAMAMKPMGLREIADEIGVHESTVSRVTNNKYIATPVGVFELKYFFSRAMQATSGRSFSGTAIRSLVNDIIDAETPEAPLSDAEITRQLASQGLVVARRTVTKYRQMLQIDAVDRRRRMA